jgi:hypothetical protein
MPAKKNKFRDLKPTKDAKGGGGRGLTQGGGATQGGRGLTQGLSPSPSGKGGSTIVDPPVSTEGGFGNK